MRFNKTELDTIWTSREVYTIRAWQLAVYSNILQSDTSLKTNLNSNIKS